MTVDGSNHLTHRERAGVSRALRATLRPTMPTETDGGWRELRERYDGFDSLDRAIAAWMERWSVPVLRVALGVVFVWFGALKVFGVSPAGDLVAATVYVVPPEVFVPILGIWEVIIGLCLLYRPLIRLGILLLAFQLPGTFLPLVLLPEVAFVTFPHALTVEGQYIVKNLVIIGAALVVGGAVRPEVDAEEVEDAVEEAATEVVGGEESEGTGDREEMGDSTGTDGDDAETDGDDAEPDVDDTETTVSEPERST